MKTEIKYSLLFLFAVLVAFPAYSQKTIKRKVAIGRFTNETQYAKGVFFDKENDPMRKQAMDILSSKLASTGKFILLERDDLDVLMEEAGSSMQKIGADYLILGSITEFGRKEVGTQKFLSSSKSQIVEAAVNIRLVEAATGMIIYSEEGKGYAETTKKQTLGMGGKAGYDATLSDKAISAAIEQLVENIINKCMDKPWRGYILSIEDGTFILSGGSSQGIASGDSFAVYKKGKSVINPQTGLKIELPGTKVGALTVYQCLGDTPETEISLCNYSGSQINAESIAEYYVSNK